MNQVYGKEFAAVYAAKWGVWGPKMWPFLSETVNRRVPGARMWLDLCCGAGSLLKLAYEHGYAAAGVDISRHQLRWAHRHVPGARLFRQDVRRLSLPRRFDVITCMFDSLNYLLTRKDLLATFRKARAHLAGHGVFVFDMNTFEGLQTRWRRTSVQHERDLFLIIESSFELRRARGRCVITGFVRNGKLYRKFQEEHIERGYKPEEIEALLRTAGFLFSKYDGDKLGKPKKRSGRLLYVCW